MSARPWDGGHWWLSLPFPVIYACFNVIYWAAGGTDYYVIIKSIVEINIVKKSFILTFTSYLSLSYICIYNNIALFLNFKGNSYIYDILDWSNDPGMAVAYLAAALVCIIGIFNL